MNDHAHARLVQREVLAIPICRYIFYIFQRSTMKHCYLLLQGRVRINEFGDREPTIQVYQYKCRQHGIQTLR